MATLDRFVMIAVLALLHDPASARELSRAMPYAKQGDCPSNARLYGRGLSKIAHSEGVPARTSGKRGYYPWQTQALWVERSRLSLRADVLKKPRVRSGFGVVPPSGFGERARLRALFPAVLGTGRASLGVRCRDHPDMANLPGDRCQAVKGLSATAAYPKPQAKTGGGDNGACEPPCSRLE
jgi:hypothetical protein